MSAPVSVSLEAASSDQIGKIIDSLGITRMHWLIAGFAAMGYMSDSFDTYVVSFAMPLIASEWLLTPTAMGSLASSGMWGMFLGALLFGPISDRFGRRSTFAGTIFGFSLLTALTALSGSLAAFLTFRVATGVFLGGMLPVASIMVAEQFGTAHRGKFVAFPPVFWPLGLFMAAAASSLLIPRYGWRGLFIAGLFPVVLSISSIKVLPESPRWLAGRGFVSQASVELRRLSTIKEWVPRFQVETTIPTSGLLFHSPYRKRLVLAALVLFFGFFGYYGFLLWLPSILTIRFHIALVRTFEYTGLVGLFSILGKLTAMFTVDRWGRKQLLYTGFGLAGLMALIFGQLQNPVPLLVGACLLSFLLEEAAAGCVVLPTELFPSQIRGTANSWTSAAGKLAAAVSPMVFGFLLNRGSYYLIFVSISAFLWLACLIVFLLDVDPARKPLEEVGA